MARLKPAFAMKRKNIVMVVSIAIVVVVASSLAYWLLIGAEDKKVEPVSLDEARTNASRYLNEGDVEGGLRYYDEQVSLSEDDESKSALLIQQSGLARRAKRPNDAIEAAMRAYEANPSAASAEALAKAYDDANDRRRAVIYYSKAIEMSPGEGMASRYKTSWEDRIKVLENDND